MWSSIPAMTMTIGHCLGKAGVSAHYLWKDIVLPALASQIMRSGVPGGSFLTIPSSICSWTCCPWGLCPGECGDRQEKELEKFMEHKQVLERDRSFPSVRLYLYLPLGREEESEDRIKSPAQVRDVPSPRCWQGRNWDPSQSWAGWVEHLSQWSPASILVFPRARLELAWWSWDLLPNICLQHTGMTSPRTLCFLHSGELQGWKSRAGDQEASAELCDKAKPYGLGLYYLSRVFFLIFPCIWPYLKWQKSIQSILSSLLFLAIKYHTVLFERQIWAVLDEQHQWQ